MSREQYNWNPVFNIVMNVKDAYNEHFKDGLLNLERWLEKLDMKEFNEFFDCLQINQDNDLVLIRYGLAEVQNGMWQDEESPYREARSVVIDIRKSTAQGKVLLEKSKGSFHNNKGSIRKTQ